MLVKSKGVRAGGAEGLKTPPPLPPAVSEIDEIFRAKRKRFRQIYWRENILEGSQGQACRLLSLTFALSKWSSGQMM